MKRNQGDGRISRVNFPYPFCKCIRSGREINDNGLYFELQAFKYQVFLDFREVYDTSGEYESLKNHLNGRGVPSIDQLRIDLKLKPIHDAYYNIFDGVLFDSIDTYLRDGRMEDYEEKEKFVTNRYQYFLGQLKYWYNQKNELNSMVIEFREGIYAIRDLNNILGNENFNIEKNQF